MKKMHSNPNTKRLENGSYTLAAVAFFIAAVILVNFIAAAVPTAFTVFDLTDQKLYSIGGTTKGVLDALEEDVTLYFISESGMEDEGVSKLLDSYDGYSSRVRVEKIDAVANPLFAKQYADGAVALNSVIAVAGEKSKVASYNSFYAYDYSEYGYSASAWDAEGVITSAIGYVTSKDTTKLYYTTGHDELDLGAELTDAIEKANIDLEPLNLLSSKVPEDCDGLILFAPGVDLTEDEAKKVLDYVGDGGNALIVSMAELVNGAPTPNFDSIMAAYGVTKASGIVMEADDAHYVQAPYLLVPDIASNTAITSAIANQNLVYSLAEGLEIREDDDDPYTVQPLLVTSKNAYLKEDLDQTVTKAAGDAGGQYALAVAVEQSFSVDDFGEADVVLEDSGLDGADGGSGLDVAGSSGSADEPRGAKMTKILYYTSPCALNSAALSSLIQQSTALPEGNRTLVTESISYLTDREVSISVAPKSLATPQTTINAGAVSVLGSLFMYILPAVALGGGFSVWFRRRKR